MTGQTRRRHLVGLSAAAALLGGGGVAYAVELKEYLDTWSGTLDTGSGKVRLELDILSKSAAHITLIGTRGVGASRVKLTADSVTLEFDRIGSTFAGSLTSPDTLTGVYTQAGKTLPLEFARGELFIIREPIEFSQETLSKARQSSGAPALGAAFSSKGAPATILVDGLRSSKASVAVTPADQWQLGSITKSMTATLVARFVEARKVSWDMTVGDVLGPSAPKMRDDYKAVTFRHLLSHHAGLQRDVDEKDWPDVQRNNPDRLRAERL